MGSSLDPQSAPAFFPPIAGQLLAPTDALVSQLGALVEQLEEAHRPQVPSAVSPAIDARLAQARLGIAGSLYVALRCKHAATAAHDLRVALSASAWAADLELPDAHRDMIEVAALLHDVGVIGVPDQVLLKPDQLDAEESQVIERSRKMSLEILRCACAEPGVLEIVEHVAAWFDGSKEGYAVAGEQIPLGARMISILEAFDAMTTDRVYRRAMSQERAMSELFRHAGTQFDPELVRHFAQLQVRGASQLRHEAAGRWLRMLEPERVNSFWSARALASIPFQPDHELLFPARLLDNMHDAVVFFDSQLRIVYWNHGAERLTGITADSIVQHPWSAALLNMRNEKGKPLAEDDCPVRCATSTGVQSLRRLSICGRTGRTVVVDAHAIPVPDASGAVLGAILLLHDASSETSLELRCQSLHEKATKDPLTQVANRAEFDRVHEMFVTAHREHRVPCSLIICDLDHFKQVNDTYGHQAGDEAIKSLAALMKKSCRAGDLVARYGGEEFVMLCADCDNATAARRAEAIRQALAQLRHPGLGGQAVTASFGVTEIQPGDTPETMLRRADRALLMAKEQGRNAVVQLGVGSGREDSEKAGGFWWRRPADTGVAIKQQLLTPVPIQMAIEKLRGFVADHRATIERIEGNSVVLHIEDSANRRRRFGDRPVVFCVELALEENPADKPRAESGGTSPTSTRVRVSISPQKNRDRRRDDIAQRATEVLVSLRSYLMATEVVEAPPDGLLGSVRPVPTL